MKTLGWVAIATAATVLFFPPFRRLLEKYADRRANDEDHGDELVGKFAGHYLGLNRHHSRKADNRKPVAAS